MVEPRRISYSTFAKPLRTGQTNSYGEQARFLAAISTGFSPCIERTFDYHGPMTLMDNPIDDLSEPSVLRGHVDAVAAAVAVMTPTAGLTWCAQVRQVFDAVEAGLLARVVTDDDGDDRRASRLARRRGVSKRESTKRAARGKAIAANPGLGDRLDDGSLSGEELDLLASAAAKSDDDALFDDHLINKVGAAGPDQGKRIVRDWLNERESASTADEKYQYERQRRAIWKFTTRDGVPALAIAGDQAFRDAVWAQAEIDADRLYREDGGRNLPLGEHPRTHDQRLFDGFTDRLMGSGSGASSSAKPTVVVTVSLDKLVGHDPHGCAEQIGTGPISDTVLAKYVGHGDLVGLLFDTAGQPLWLGRKRRHASAAQHLALTIRDKGCVLCDAPAHRCQAHHVMPWHALLKGRTDSDQMVLLCGSCHRQVHQDKMTVIRDQQNQCWTTRPATANEIPPDPPPRTQK